MVSSIEFQYLPNLIKTYNLILCITNISLIFLYLIQLCSELIGLEIFDSEEIETHGGSMRVYIKNKENKKLTISKKKLNILIKK